MKLCVDFICEISKPKDVEYIASNRSPFNFNYWALEGGHTPKARPYQLKNREELQ